MQLLEDDEEEDNPERTGHLSLGHDKYSTELFYPFLVIDPKVRCVCCISSPFLNGIKNACQHENISISQSASSLLLSGCFLKNNK